MSTKTNSKWRCVGCGSLKSPLTYLRECLRPYGRSTLCAWCKAKRETQELIESSNAKAAAHKCPLCKREYDGRYNETPQSAKESAELRKPPCTYCQEQEATQ